MDRIVKMESNGICSTKRSQMVMACCLSNQAIKKFNGMDESIKLNRMDRIRLSVVKWSNGVLELEHSGCKKSDSNGWNRTDGVE